MNEKTIANFMAEIVLISQYLVEPDFNKKDTLHKAEIRALKIIYTKGPISMNELAQVMYNSRPRTTQIVSKLITKQLVEQVKGGDKRMIYVVTNSKGKQTVKKIRAKYTKIACAIENKLGPKDTQELARILNKVGPMQQLPID